MKWLTKILSFSFGFWLGMFLTVNAFAFVFIISNSIADFRWEKDIDMKIKQLQYENLINQSKK